jgi:frataxin
VAPAGCNGSGGVAADRGTAGMASLDDSSFAQLADDTLAGLMERIEDILSDRADVDLQEGILTIDLDEGGRYVINKHVLNRQIWLSSPFSGAAHFNYDPEQGWVGTRGGETLHTLLEQEIAKLTGTAVSLQ